MSNSEVIMQEERDWITAVDGNIQATEQTNSKCLLNQCLSLIHIQIYANYMHQWKRLFFINICGNICVACTCIVSSLYANSCLAF